MDAPEAGLHSRSNKTSDSLSGSVMSFQERAASIEASGETILTQDVRKITRALA